MYVTTFYSFKGGVGRTMALVNAAVELAQRGRRVLAVDFDLEAPGLDTFNVLRTRKKRPGIVDFVTEYLDTGRAPEVERFVHESKGVGENGGCLHVMPSGEQHARYATSYREIDWLDLYERRDGFLLFEDLKAQWEQFVKPDYVLIDSRTGHTDTGGICTRQLPDAVAILFFPNDQNLRGLTTVVQDIRFEARSPRNKQIDLHFVMSNVPDLDDEDRVLERKIDAFREKLGFTGEPLMLHRYDSLSLLNQAVFTKDRPRSRLAKEYRDLVDEIVGRNLEDKDGALRYIGQAGQRDATGTTYETAEEIDRKLARIEKAHGGDGKGHRGDGEVLFALGLFMEEKGQRERAKSLWDRAIKAGCVDPEAYLKRARSRDDSGDSAGACEDALQMLQVPDLSHSLVLDAARLVPAERAGDVAASAAVNSMDGDGRIWVARELDQSPGQIAVAIPLLQPIAHDDVLPAGERRLAGSLLASRYIGTGRCDEAATLLCDGGRDVGDMDIEEVFDYGMALWGETGEVVRGPFDRFLQLDEASEDRDPHLNRYVRMTLAYWATGQLARTRDYLELAREALAAGMGVWGDSAFSCWRYYEPSASEFLEDLDGIEALINGDTSHKPRFMTAAEEASDVGE